MNKRRELIAALGAGALAASFRVSAQQQGKVWRVGFLSQRSLGPLDSDVVGGFPAGMRGLGYVEGKNLVIEWRSAEGNYDRLPAMAAELVRMNVDVIVTVGGRPTLAAQQATNTIPIVFGSANDPVGMGLVKSLAHPGGNITGLANISSDFAPKLLEMLISMVPKASRIAVLTNPENRTPYSLSKTIEAAAQGTRVATILPMAARTPQEIEKAFATIAREKADATIVQSDGFFFQQRRQIVELAAKHRLPVIAMRKAFVETGILMSYGPNTVNFFQRAATYVDKIFKGAKPADLPVEQPTTLELVINRKTATALGLKIPQSLLISADKVIE